MSPSPRPGGDAETPTPRRLLPERASLEQLRKEAKDLLRDARGGDASALARITATKCHAPGGRIILAQAQLALAREYGFPSWPKLARHVESVSGGGFVRRPLIRPVELSPGRRWKLADGTDATTDDVFAMFVAACDGDIASVKRLVTRVPSLATVEYNYTPPIHFAVREGRAEAVPLLLDKGADPEWNGLHDGSLIEMARERGHTRIVQILDQERDRRGRVVTQATDHPIYAAAERMMVVPHSAFHIRRYRIAPNRSRRPTLAWAPPTSTGTALPVAGLGSFA